MAQTKLYSSLFAHPPLPPVAPDSVSHASDHDEPFRLSIPDHITGSHTRRQTITEPGSHNRSHTDVKPANRQGTTTHPLLRRRSTHTAHTKTSHAPEPPHSDAPAPHARKPFISDQYPPLPSIQTSPVYAYPRQPSASSPHELHARPSRTIDPRSIRPRPIDPPYIHDPRYGLSAHPTHPARTAAASFESHARRHNTPFAHRYTDRYAQDQSHASLMEFLVQKIYTHWVKKELNFTMSKLSVVVLVIGLCLLSALLFITGFLVAVNVYDTTPYASAPSSPATGVGGSVPSGMIPSMPTMQMPVMQMPSIQTPVVQMPSIQAPNIPVPSVQIPTPQMPPINMGVGLAAGIATASMVPTSSASAASGAVSSPMVPANAPIANVPTGTYNTMPTGHHTRYMADVPMVETFHKPSVYAQLPTHASYPPPASPAVMPAVSTHIVEQRVIAPSAVPMPSPVSSGPATRVVPSSPAVVSTVPRVMTQPTPQPIVTATQPMVQPPSTPMAYGYPAGYNNGYYPQPGYGGYPPAPYYPQPQGYPPYPTAPRR